MDKAIEEGESLVEKIGREVRELEIIDMTTALAPATFDTPCTQPNSSDHRRRISANQQSNSYYGHRKADPNQKGCVANPSAK